MSRSFKVLLGVLGGAVLVLVLLPVFAGSGLFGSTPMMGQGGMLGSGWGVFEIIWMLVPLLFFGGLIALVVLAVTQLGSGGIPPVEREEFTTSRPRSVGSVGQGLTSHPSSSPHQHRKGVKV